MWASNPSTHSPLKWVWEIVSTLSELKGTLSSFLQLPPHLRNPLYNSFVPASFTIILLKPHKSDQVPAGWAQAIGATHRKGFWIQATEARSRDYVPKRTLSGFLLSGGRTFCYLIQTSQNKNLIILVQQVTLDEVPMPGPVSHGQGQSLQGSKGRADSLCATGDRADHETPGTTLS